ncbi:hypothetical protein C5N14_10035 [Micromonospora sp. MW-13]|uniref:hypothetical protein n=1 Tax=Micromonospora sp. MW-13 TaxID=2094022 RepID=UPI000E42DB39|nr:hypothetical protein [Micromonospora sp. MW-13]RGC69094.1 hypothetical protein C5N14_10035 [Micromonospora sp. MW-13]
MTYPATSRRRTGPGRAVAVAVAGLTVTALAGCGMIGVGGAGDGGAAPAAGGGPGLAATPTPGGDPLPTATSQAPEEPPAAPPVDACDLVSKREAEKLAGTPLDDPVAIRETCTYTGPVTGPTAQVEVFVGDGAKKFLDIERELGHEFTPIAGAGDEAYAEDGTVFVNKGGVWVSIRLVRTDDPARYRKPLADLARTVAGRL